MLVKVCGLTRQEDVQCANALGVDFCGFIFHPKSPRYIEPQKAARLESGNMRRVGVFVGQDAAEIRHIMEVAHLDFAQLHGKQSIDTAMQVGVERVIRVLWPQRYCHKALLYRELCRHANSCAMFLFDAGQSGGGSGQRIDWGNIAGLASPRPWFLAGGLNARNVVSAMKLTGANAADLNSGIEIEPGIKSAQAMQEAVRQVRQFVE